jgi:hypothetical protein
VSVPGASTSKAEPSGDLVIGKIKVYGKIVNKNKEPISNVNINIYNESSQVIKKRQTDAEGYWEVRLPAGRYGIEYAQKGFKPINRNIELSNDMKMFGEIMFAVKFFNKERSSILIKQIILFLYLQ